MIRFAIIGTNYVTDWFLQAGALCPDFALEAVYSRTLERARAYNAGHGAPLLFTNLHDLAACSSVDAVYIASPNALHASQALALIRAGKHVLVEKPAASNLRETQCIVNAASECGVVFMEAVKTAFSPGFAAIRQGIARLGQLRRVVAVNCQYSRRYDNFRNNIIENAFNPALSNAALLDIGVYCVHPLVKLLGRPEGVAAAATFLPNGFEGQGSITCTYPGMLAGIHYSKITTSCLGSEIQGEDGNLIIDHFARMDAARICYRDGRVEELAIPEVRHAMLPELEHFISAVQGRVDISDCTQATLDAAWVMTRARELTGAAFPADTLKED